MVLGERQLVFRQRVVLVRFHEVLAAQRVLQRRIAFVDAGYGRVELVDDLALPVRRGEEVGPGGEPGHHVEPVVHVHVDVEERVGLAGEREVLHLLERRAFHGFELQLVLAAEVFQLLAALLGALVQRHAQRAARGQVRLRESAVRRREQRGVGRAVAVLGVLVQLGELLAVHHVAFEVHLPGVEHVQKGQRALVFGLSLRLNELVGPSGVLGDVHEVIVGVAAERSVVVALDHAFQVDVPHLHHALLRRFCGVRGGFARLGESLADLGGWEGGCEGEHACQKHGDRGPRHNGRIWRSEPAYGEYPLSEMREPRWARLNS